MHTIGNPLVYVTLNVSKDFNSSLLNFTTFLLKEWAEMSVSLTGQSIRHLR